MAHGLQTHTQIKPVLLGIKIVPMGVTINMLAISIAVGVEEDIEEEKWILLYKEDMGRYGH